MTNSNDTERSTGHTAPISLGTKLAYGFGSVAYGVKDNGFSYFLLLFYNQVLGLDARLVGLAITTALIIDAISDPIVGYWSDNLRSRLGRRHPFMYASAIPVSLSYYLLWSPPLEWSQTSLFWYLLLLTVFIRTCITLYETPSTALAPELSEDYVQRSSLLSFRFYFGWTGGVAMTVLMFFFLFPASVTNAISDGRFNPDSYALYGIIASVLLFVSIMVSSLGTHSHISKLKPAPAKRKLPALLILKEVVETLSDRSFFALFFASLLGAVATGLSAALLFYFYTYFWGFSSTETGLMTMGVFLSAFIGLFLAPVVTSRIGKKRGAMIVGLVAFIGYPLPMTLRLLGILPQSGDVVFWFVFTTSVIDTGLIICFQILTVSMLSDLVDQSELKTGRRSEGLFFAAYTFIRKSTQGIGLMAASMMLYLADFPEAAETSQLTKESANTLVTMFIPSIVLVWTAMLVVISFYRLDREQHEENLRLLAARNSSG